MKLLDNHCAVRNICYIAWLAIAEILEAVSYSLANASLGDMYLALNSNKTKNLYYLAPITQIRMPRSICSEDSTPAGAWFTPFEQEDF